MIGDFEMEKLHTFIQQKMTDVHIYLENFTLVYDEKIGRDSQNNLTTNINMIIFIFFL